MTIYTTDNSDKKELIDDKVTVEVICPEKKALTTELEDVPLDGEYSVYNDPVVPIRRQPRPVKRRLCLQLCLFIGMLTGLCISILASLYLYKTMSISTVRYRGRCGVGVVNIVKPNASDPNAPQRQVQLTEMLEEDVDINDNVEKLSVPNANITHDFNKNLTAIKDLEKDLCFLLPLLSSSLVPPPHTFFEELDISERDGLYPLYYPEVISEFTICNGDNCFEGSAEDLPELCGEYTPMYAVPAYQVNPAATAQPETTPGILQYDYDGEVPLRVIKELDRMFRSYAGGDSVVTYHIVN